MKKEHIITFQQLTHYYFYLVLSAVSLQMVLLVVMSSCYVMFTTQYTDRDFTYLTFVQKSTYLILQLIYINVLPVHF